MWRGHPIYESYLTGPLRQAVERAWQAGLIVVCAARSMGTSGCATVGSPGNDPFMITIAPSSFKESVPIL